MTDPLTALLTTAAALTVTTLLLWPERGYIWRWRRAFRNNERVLMEDALKHLYDYEYKKLPCTLQSVCGALGIRDERAARLLTRLEALDLIKSQGGNLLLTDEGRSYALRIIRIHRVWERYLADETGVPAQEWHAQAELKEHKMSLPEANELAARMGNPRFDPHGDPIPSASGDIAPSRGVPLGELAPGQFGEVIHVEDEPEAVFAQLVAQGLHPGLVVQMIDSSPQRIRYAADGEEYSLAPVFAANVTVMPVVERVADRSGYPTLSQLQPGESGRVVGISKGCLGQQRRRLMDLGVIPGTQITVQMRSAAGDPVAYLIRGALIALRKGQSDQILIEKMGEQVQ